MRTELLVLSVFALTACRNGGWPDIHFDRVPADPRLGIEFAQGSPMRTGTIATAWNQDGIYVAVLEDPGVDVEFKEQPSQLRAFKIDPVTGASTKLPDPPFPPFHDEWGWATPWVPAFLGNGMIIAEESEDWHRILVYEGSWRQLEYPTYIRSAESLAGRPGDQFVIISGHHALSYSALTWEELPVGPDGSLTLGPWDDKGVRILVWSNNTLKVMLFDVAKRTLLEQSQLDNVLSVGFPRFQNGTTSDFRFIATVQGENRVVHFKDGAFTMGPSIGASLTLDTPGADALVGIGTATRYIDHLTWGPFFKVSADDTLQAFGTGGEPMTTTCPCDRETEPTCKCLPRAGAETPVVHETRASPSGRSLSAVFGDTADGVRRYTMRRVDLPYTQPPMSEPFPTP